MADDTVPATDDWGIMDRTKICVVGFSGDGGAFSEALITLDHDLSDADIVQLIDHYERGDDIAALYGASIGSTLSEKSETPFDLFLGNEGSVKIVYYLTAEGWYFEPDGPALTLKEPDPYGQFWGLRPLGPDAAAPGIIRLQYLNATPHYYYFNLHAVFADAGAIPLSVTIDPVIGSESGGGVQEP